MAKENKNYWEVPLFLPFPLARNYEEFIDEQTNILKPKL